MPDIAVLAESFYMSALFVQSRALLVGTNRRSYSGEVSDGRLEDRRGVGGPRHNKSRIAQDPACMAWEGDS